MKKLIALFCTGLILALSAALVSAQVIPSASPSSSTVAQTSTEPALYFPRYLQPAYTNGTRRPDGNPGSNYWQNKSEFRMKVNVAPPDRVISATEELTYINNSPYPLPSIMFRLYPNSHTPGALRERPMPEDFLTSGIHIDEFRINGVTTEWTGEAAFTVHGVTLDQPLAPGASIDFSFTWHYDIAPEHGWKEGAIDETTYYLAYFYPRVTVLDDVSLSFDSTPFTLSREFYNNFSDYMVEVTAPKNFVVWATGDLLNIDEVLQPTYAQRLRESFTSDEEINIAQPEELAQGVVTAQTDTVTWKWQAENVPDFAIGLSDHYIWDAGSVVVDPTTNRRASVQAAYNREATDFYTMVADAKGVLAWASTEYPGVPYPYSKTTIIRGDADEEYPMMVNDKSNAGTEELERFPSFTRFVVAHEILHSWFPFYMGINETRYAFMEEGWTTAFEYLFNVHDIGEAEATELFKTFRMPPGGWQNPQPGSELPVITPNDSLSLVAPAVGHNRYSRPALGYLALKDLMGDEAFKQALREFIDRWNGKYPNPWDMYNTFNDVANENYNWFFNNWFFSYHYIDLAIADVQPTDSGYTIQVQNVGGAAIPFDVEVVYGDDSTERFHQNPRIWQASPQAVAIEIPSTQELKAVSLDNGIFVDFNPEDDTWESS